MKKVILNTQMQEGMYMDIEAIEFQFDQEGLRKQVEKALQIIRENVSLIDRVELKMFGNTAIQSISYFDSEKEDEEKTTDVSSKIDIETIRVSSYGLWYRGYNKYTSDYLEINLESLLK